MIDAVLPWLAEPLARALANQRSHATLVHGPTGVGQFEFACALATAWLCEDAARRPCGQCVGCRLMAQQSHPDCRLLAPQALREAIVWPSPLPPRDDTKPSREIRIDEVREAIDWGSRTASRGGAKVLLLHPSQALNPAAANALLKTLEEPPAPLRLVLTADDPASLLATLRSRCQRIALVAPPPAVALPWLQGKGVADAALLLAAAGGQPLLARSMAADGLTAALWGELPASVRRGHTAPLMSLPLPRLIDALQRLCHDAIAVALGAAPRYRSDAGALAGARLQALQDWSAELQRASRHDEHPWNAGLLAESLLSLGHKAWQTNAGARRPSPTLAAP